MRALNMQALTRAVQSRWPNVTIYGKGDAAHAARSSDHNEDDTPGVVTPQTDADKIPEHRAIDVMLKAGVFTAADADRLVEDILDDATSRARLLNIIWNGHIWSRSWNWARRVYSGADQHKDHIHFSGLASEDENTAEWTAVTKGVNMTEMFPRYGENHDGVEYMQFQLENLGYDVGTVDGDYGDKTAVALAQFVAAYTDNKVKTDGKRLTPTFKIYLDATWSRKFGKDDFKPLTDRLTSLENTVKALPTSDGLQFPMTVVLSKP